MTDPRPEGSGTVSPAPSLAATEQLTEALNEGLSKPSKTLPPRLTAAAEWPLWALKMELHLRAYGVWGIVDGTSQPPGETATAKEKAKYNKEKSRAHGDLLKCLGPTFEQLAATYSEPKQIWDCLKEICVPTKSAQLLTIEQKINNLTTYDPLTSCLLELKQLVRELKQKGGEMTEDQQSLKLLELLLSEFTELKLTVQTTEDFHQTDGATPPKSNGKLHFERIFQVAYKRALLHETTQQLTKISMFSESSYPRNSLGNLVCRVCRERGHTEANCIKCPLCLKSNHRAHTAVGSYLESRSI